MYEENFENRNSITDLEVEGWRNVNVNGGDNLFALNKSNGNNSVQLGAFRSGENPMEVWLVSPPINLDASINESLSFDTLTGYNNGEALSIWVAADFTGDIESATWLHIEDAKLADGPVSGYQTNFTNSGSVDVSCLSGNIHLAFRYLGGDGTVTTTFRIDNVKFTGSE
nr:choice-of-anchor J domain-containing protein [Tenacibaculum maritimum]